MIELLHIMIPEAFKSYSKGEGDAVSVVLEERNRIAGLLRPFGLESSANVYTAIIYVLRIYKPSDFSANSHPDKEDENFLLDMKDISNIRNKVSVTASSINYIKVDEPSKVVEKPSVDYKLIEKDVEIIYKWVDPLEAKKVRISVGSTTVEMRSHKAEYAFALALNYMKKIPGIPYDEILNTEKSLPSNTPLKVTLFHKEAAQKIVDVTKEIQDSKKNSYYFKLILLLLQEVGYYADYDYRRFYDSAKKWGISIPN